MKYIGAHVSAAKGVSNAPVNAADFGADAFALFVKNQRRWEAPPISQEEAQKFKLMMSEKGFSKEFVVPHDSYLINLGNFSALKRERSLNSFIDEIKRVEQLGLCYLNFHPGSTLGEGSVSDCLKIISESINYALDKSSGVTLLIENTAGQGSQVGKSFSEIAGIIDLVEDKQRIGVCLDTCHAFQAGYDFSSRAGIDELFIQFADIIGLDKLKALHLNDSMKEINCHIDRHASIGQGKIGRDSFAYLMKLEILDDIPIILETPDDELWPEEIDLLKSFAAT